VARNENPKGAASTVSEARSAARGVRRAKKSSGSRGSATRPLAPEEADQQGDGCHREGRHQRGGHRAVRQLRDDEDECKQAECAATRAGQIVRAARRARRVRGDDPYGDERDGQHHRYLDEEDPTPVQRVGHEPAEHEPHREPRARARTEDPQRAVALLPLGERWR